MSYSLLDWVEIWQIFIPRRLELLKTHHCVLYNYSSEQINKKYRHHDIDRHSLRKNTNNFLRVPEIQLRRKCTGFTYCGAKMFNNLPNNIRETQDCIIFKKLVKNWIWDEVPSYWQIIDYIKIFILLIIYIYIFIFIFHYHLSPWLSLEKSA